MWKRPTVVQQGPTSIEKCRKRRNVETSLVCNFSAAGVKDWVKGSRNKRQERQGAVCCATPSRDTVVCQSWRGQTSPLQQHRPWPCDKSKGAGCRLGPRKTFSPKPTQRVDSRTQTLISKQSRRQSTMNLSATLSTIYVLLVLVPGECRRIAMSLSTSSVPLSLACLSVCPAICFLDSKAGRFDPALRPPPAGRCNSIRSAQAFDLHTLTPS